MIIVLAECLPLVKNEIAHLKKAGGDLGVAGVFSSVENLLRWRESPGIIGHVAFGSESNS